jgi:hypothetical protein
VPITRCTSIASLPLVVDDADLKAEESDCEMLS